MIEANCDINLVKAIIKFRQGDESGERLIFDQVCSQLTTIGIESTSAENLAIKAISTLDQLIPYQYDHNRYLQAFWRWVGATVVGNQPALFYPKPEKFGKDPKEAVIKAIPQITDFAAHQQLIQLAAWGVDYADIATCLDMTTSSAKSTLVRLRARYEAEVLAPLGYLRFGYFGIPLAESTLKRNGSLLRLAHCRYTTEAGVYDYIGRQRYIDPRVVKQGRVPMVDIKHQDIGLYRYIKKHHKDLLEKDHSRASIAAEDLTRIKATERPDVGENYVRLYAYKDRVNYGTLKGAVKRRELKSVKSGRRRFVPQGVVEGYFGLE